MSQKIRINQSYDHNLIDKSSEKIVKTVKSTGVVNGPIPLPTNKRLHCPPLTAREQEIEGAIPAFVIQTPHGHLFQLIQDDRRLDEARAAQRCRSRNQSLTRRKNASAHWEKSRNDQHLQRRG